MTTSDPSTPSSAPDPGAATPPEHRGTQHPGTTHPGSTHLGSTHRDTTPRDAAHRPAADEPWAPVWAAPTAGPTSSAPPPPSAGSPAPQWSAAAPAWSGGSAPAATPSRQRRWPWVAGALAMVLLLAGGAALAVAGGRAAWDAMGAGASFGLEEGETYGDNPVLDALWDDCETGDGAACDDLFDSSGIGTGYEDFGYTCGERYSDASAPFLCAEEELETSVARDGVRYGDDAVLDRLWDGCEAGDGVDCDELYASSEEGTEYALFGVTCGERYSALRAPDFCAEALG